MCLVLHIPLDSIYNLTDEDYDGLIDMSHEMNNEGEGQMSGKSYTRQATAKELSMLNKN